MDNPTNDLPSLGGRGGGSENRRRSDASHIHVHVTPLVEKPATPKDEQSNLNLSVSPTPASQQTEVAEPAQPIFATSRLHKQPSGTSNSCGGSSPTQSLPSHIDSQAIPFRSHFTPFRPMPPREFSLGSNVKRPHTGSIPLPILPADVGSKKSPRTTRTARSPGTGKGNKKQSSDRSSTVVDNKDQTAPAAEVSFSTTTKAMDISNEYVSYPKHIRSSSFNNSKSSLLSRNTGLSTLTMGPITEEEISGSGGSSSSDGMSSRFSLTLSAALNDTRTGQNIASTDDFAIAGTDDDSETIGTNDDGDNDEGILARVFPDEETRAFETQPGTSDSDNGFLSWEESVQSLKYTQSAAEHPRSPIQSNNITRKDIHASHEGEMANGHPPGWGRSSSYESNSTSRTGNSRSNSSGSIDNSIGRSPTPYRPMLPRELLRENNLRVGRYATLPELPADSTSGKAGGNARSPALSKSR